MIDSSCLVNFLRCGTLLGILLLLLLLLLLCVRVCVVVVFCLLLFFGVDCLVHYIRLF